MIVPAMNRDFKMNLSTNLPSGLSTAEYINQDRDLLLNVSKEADAAFMAELKRTDEPRYNRLVTIIQRSAYAHDRRTEPVDRCCSCGASLTGKRQGSKWCSDTCRMRLGRQNNPKTHIQNKGAADAKIEGLGGPVLELSKAPENGCTA
jgi:hypothetical protein